MADEWVPTTEQVRDGYSHDPEADYRDPLTNHHALNARAFDRWLEAHDRTERAAALREAADAIVRSDTAFPGMTIRDAVRETLARAECIERGELQSHT